MDIFKLLTRSSNLQKSGPVISHQQIPSAGFNPSKNISEADNSFLEAGPGTLNQGKVARGADDTPSEKSTIASSRQSRKRKRDDDGLDRHESPDLAKNSNSHSHEKNVPIIDDGRMSEKTESRRILKQHKLKITLLNSQPDPGSKLVRRREKKKEKAPQQDISLKNTFTPLTPVPLTSFKQLRSKYCISKRLAENLDCQGYFKPTEVQMGSLPILLGTDADRGLSSQGLKKDSRRRSEVDLLTVAPTGSGKTLAFLIHIIQGLLGDPRRREKESKLGSKGREREVQALVIAPTHELADQIVNEGRKIMGGTGLKISGLKKGSKLGLPSQLNSEDKNDRSSSLAEEQDPEHEFESHSEPVVKTDVLVSTPMMLVNSISSTSESAPNALPGIRYLILDEADILLDPLFRAQTLSIWSACSNPTLTTSLWSATIGSSIESLAISFINERRKKLNLFTTSNPPTHHQIIRLIVGLKDSAVSNISHRLIYTASEQGKLLALRQMLHPAAISTGDAPSIQPPFLIFTQTIPRAIALHSELLYDIPLEAGGSSRLAVLHSDLSITARAAIMAGFRRGEIWILITTDLLSRGVDFRGVNGVVNYDIPNTGAAYIHRVGRTGRQQREGGIAVTFYTKEDIPYVKNIANVISNSEKLTAATTKATLKNKDKDKDETVPQKQKQKPTPQGHPGGMEKWLLSALPPVPKKTKRELKRKGVLSRRNFVAGGGEGKGGGVGGEANGGGVGGEGKGGGVGGKGRGGGVGAEAKGGRVGSEGKGKRSKNRAAAGGSNEENNHIKKLARSTRISTKSGYDRTLEHKRKDAWEKARRKRGKGDIDREDDREGEEEWGGIED